MPHYYAELRWQLDNLFPTLMPNHDVDVDDMIANGQLFQVVLAEFHRLIAVVF